MADRLKAIITNKTNKGNYMTIKTLEAWCKARGYKGGTIWQMLEDLKQYSQHLVPENNGPYSWGVREAMALRHGDNIMHYPVPVNSWLHDSSESVATMEYLCGLYDVLEDYEFTVQGKKFDAQGLPINTND